MGGTWRGDQVAVPNDDFMDGPLCSIAFRRELALLDGALDEDIVAFLESHGNARQIAIERQAVPIGLLLRFAVRVLIAVGFPEADVGDRRWASSGRRGEDLGQGHGSAADTAPAD